VGPTEKNDYKVNSDFFDNNYPVVFEDENIKIYKIDLTSASF